MLKWIKNFIMWNWYYKEWMDVKDYIATNMIRTVNEDFEPMVEKDRINLYKDLYWDRWEEVYNNRTSYWEDFKNKIKEKVKIKSIWEYKTTALSR